MDALIGMLKRVTAYGTEYLDESVQSQAELDVLEIFNNMTTMEMEELLR